MAQLQIMVIDGRNLKRKDLFSENDPYVRLYLDDKKQRQKSTVKTNSRKPVWNETFVFNHIHGQDILHVDVYDEDLIFDDKIGSVKIDLQELYEKGHIDHWYDLLPRFGTSSQGQIHLILEYQPLRF